MWDWDIQLVFRFEFGHVRVWVMCNSVLLAGHLPIMHSFMPFAVMLKLITGCPSNNWRFGMNHILFRENSVSLRYFLAFRYNHVTVWEYFVTVRDIVDTRRYADHKFLHDQRLTHKTPYITHDPKFRNYTFPFHMNILINRLKFGLVIFFVLRPSKTLVTRNSTRLRFGHVVFFGLPPGESLFIWDF